MCREEDGWKRWPGGWGSRERLLPAILSSAYVSDFLGFDLAEHVIVFLAIDDIFQVHLAVLILQVDAPAGNLIDIRAVHRFLIAENAMQARFRELAGAMALVTFQFGKCVQEIQFKLMVWKASGSVANNAPFIKERNCTGHYAAPLRLSNWPPYSS